MLPLAEAHAAMNSKFWGAYRVARAVRLQEGGSLTLVSGQASQLPRGNAVLQGAINSALETLSRGLALELPEDVAQAVLYPAGSGYATGSMVLVDGGGVMV